MKARMDETVLATIQLQPGETLCGRYVLERKLGQGGMGVVWLARDKSLQRLAALKLLPDLVRQDRDAVNDLRDETRRSLELTHPNIVRIYDFEEDDRTAGISMEYVDGGSLASIRAEREQRLFEPGGLVAWVRSLCDALHYAHTEARIVHRDLKPANLLVNAKGQLKITDFGIARSITDSVSRVSGIGQTSGTLLYMSPQQLLGKPSAASDDIYSIGATLYDLITGKPPFFTGSVPVQVQSVIPPSMADRRREMGREGKAIPPEWEEVIAACLAKEPAERPKSVLEIAERLGATGHAQLGITSSAATSARAMEAATQTGQTIATSLAGTSPKFSGRGWIAVLLAALIGSGLTFFWVKHRAEQRARAMRQAKTKEAPFVEASPAPAPLPKTGSLVINSVPNGATVFVDGRPVGTTPLARDDIAPGNYRVRFHREGYEPQDIVVSVKAGETANPGVVHLAAKPPSLPTRLPFAASPRSETPPRDVLPPPRADVWLFPDSSKRLLTRQELRGLPPAELWRARNEIYARNGLIFASERGQAYARTLGLLYRGVDPDQDRVFQRMNSVEKANVELIKSFE
jgi:hypothetical protein